MISGNFSHVMFHSADTSGSQGPVPKQSFEGAILFLWTYQNWVVLVHTPSGTGTFMLCYYNEICPLEVAYFDFLWCLLTVSQSTLWLSLHSQETSQPKENAKQVERLDYRIDDMIHIPSTLHWHQKGALISLSQVVWCPHHPELNRTKVIPALSCIGFPWERNLQTLMTIHIT